MSTNLYEKLAPPPPSDERKEAMATLTQLRLMWGELDIHNDGALVLRRTGLGSLERWERESGRGESARYRLKGVT